MANTSSAAAARAGLGIASSTSNNERDEDYPYEWTSSPFSRSNPLHSGLNEMEDVITCAICQSLMSIPMLLPCNHSFCSHCITSFNKANMSKNRKASCPSCRKEFSGDKKLVPNSTLEKLIFVYKGFRPHLKDALISAATTAASNKVGESETDANENGISMAAAEDEASKPPALPDDQHVNCSRRRKRSRPNYAESEDTEVLEPRNENRDDEIDNNNNNQQRRLQKLAKVSYNNKKKRQLMEMCEEHGLPTNGTQEELKKRHESFILLYNTECDSIRPRSKEELIKETVKQERELKKAAATSRKNVIKNLKQENTDDSSATVYHKNKALDTEMKSNFKAMQAKLRSEYQERKAKEEASKSSSSPKDDGDNDDDKGPGEEDEVGKAKTEQPQSSNANDNVATTSRTPSSNRIINNPYVKGNSRLSAGSTTSSRFTSSNNADSSLLLSATTPMGTTVPNMFPPGTTLPSTITKKNSQSFALSQSPALNILTSIARKTESPNALDTNAAVAKSTSKSSSTTAAAAKSQGGEEVTSSMESDENAGENQATTMASAAPASSKPPKPKPKANKKTKSAKQPKVASRPRPPAAPAQAPTRRSNRQAPWACLTCTFENVRHMYDCEMCGNRRPSQNRAAAAASTAPQETIRL